MVKVLRGLGAVDGVACGKVVAIRSEGIPDAVPAGAILVARVVHPYLAPLFTTIGGVVVEDGGILQHAVILARELGLPAVVGIRGLLDEIHDDDRLCLDGSTGEVTVTGREGV